MPQYFTVQPVVATAGSPPNSTVAENMVKGDYDQERYVESMLDLLRTGQSPTSARNAQGNYVLTYTGGVGDDEDGWISNCEWIEQAHPGLHGMLGVRIDFTDGPYGAKAGSVR